MEFSEILSFLAAVTRLIIGAILLFSTWRKGFGREELLYTGVALLLLASV